MDWEIVASLVLLAGHRSGRRPGWLPWAALVLGTAGSLAANVAAARPDLLNRPAVSSRSWSCCCRSWKGRPG